MRNTLTAIVLLLLVGWNGYLTYRVKQVDRQIIGLFYYTSLSPARREVLLSQLLNRKDGDFNRLFDTDQETPTHEYKVRPATVTQ